MYRTDEFGSTSTGNRPLLTRRLHGQRYGKPSGIKHPAGQFTQAGRASDVAARMPGPEWKEKKHRDKFGPAGVSEDKRRKSPIVEISVLLVSSALAYGHQNWWWHKKLRLCEQYLAVGEYQECSPKLFFVLKGRSLYLNFAHKLSHIHYPEK